LISRFEELKRVVLFPQNAAAMATSATGSIFGHAFNSFRIVLASSVWPDIARIRPLVNIVNIVNVLIGTS
jgi:hypothetical protein